MRVQHHRGILGERAKSGTVLALRGPVAFERRGCRTFPKLASDAEPRLAVRVSQPENPHRIPNSGRFGGRMEPHLGGRVLSDLSCSSLEAASSFSAAVHAESPIRKTHWRYGLRCRRQRYRPPTAAETCRS